MQVKGKKERNFMTAIMFYARCTRSLFFAMVTKHTNTKIYFQKQLKYTKLNFYPPHVLNKHSNHNHSQLLCWSIWDIIIAVIKRPKRLTSANVFWFWRIFLGSDVWCRLGWDTASVYDCVMLFFFYFYSEIMKVLKNIFIDCFSAYWKEMVLCKA